MFLAVFRRLWVKECLKSFRRCFSKVAKIYPICRSTCLVVVVVLAMVLSLLMLLLEYHSGGELDNIFAGGP